MIRRWVCLTCHEGVLAPARPRKDDVRRYCLDCSRRLGRLVERVCPAHETKAKAAAEAHKAASEKRKAKLAEKRAALIVSREAAREARAALRTVPVIELHRAVSKDRLYEAARRYAKLKAWERDLSGVEVTIRRSFSKKHTTGRTRAPKPDKPGQIIVTIGTDFSDSPYAVLLHEYAHIAVGYQRRRGRGEWHGPRWRAYFKLAVEEVIGRRIEFSGILDVHQFHIALAAEIVKHVHGGAHGQEA